MNLTNEKVVHPVFGVGSVVAVDNGRIIIQFEESIKQKTFSYPSAFNQHLKMCNSLTQDFVWSELKKMLEEVAVENTRQEQERLDEANRLAAEKVIAKKPKPKKSVKTKVK